jgi:hypothetical protein
MPEKLPGNQPEEEGRASTFYLGLRPRDRYEDIEEFKTEAVHDDFPKFELIGEIHGFKVYETYDTYSRAKTGVTEVMILGGPRGDGPYPIPAKVLMENEGEATVENEQHERFSVVFRNRELVFEKLYN